MVLAEPAGGQRVDAHDAQPRIASLHTRKYGRCGVAGAIVNDRQFEVGIILQDVIDRRARRQQLQQAFDRIPQRWCGQHGAASRKSKTTTHLSCERGETVTLANKRCQGANSRFCTGLRQKTKLASSWQTSCHSGAFASCFKDPSSAPTITVSIPHRASSGRAYFTWAAEPVAIDSVRAYLQDQLPEYMLPSAFVPLAHLPLTANGKVDRKALPVPALEALNRRDFEAPVDALEQRLAALWAEVLKLEQVGRHDSFFELGGHSLLAIRLVSLMEDWCEPFPGPFLYYPSRRQTPPALRAFIDFVADWRKRNASRS